MTVDSLFEQAGVIRTDTLHELFDVASLLANQPIPAGRRVAIVTNAGGPGILCADACESRGLEVPELPASAREELAAFLPPRGVLGNPLDMIATAPAEHYRQSLEVLARHEFADAIVSIFIPPLATRSSDVADAIREAVEAFELSIPVLTVFMSTEETPAALKPDSTRAGIPSYAFPEDAARALARAADYGLWRESPEGEVPRFAEARPEEAAAVIASALGRGDGWLEPEEVERLLRCYGLPVIESRTVGTPADAGRAAERSGGAGGHQGDRAGPRPQERRGSCRSRPVRAPTRAGGGRAHRGARARSRAGADWIPRCSAWHLPGWSCCSALAHDPLFGPVIACGAGGVTAEVMKDVAVRITPLTNIDARGMLRSLRTYRLLQGFRGAPPVDIGAVESLLLRLSAMVEAHPEVAEMDCNPVIVGPDGAVSGGRAGARRSQRREASPRPRSESQRRSRMLPNSSMY